jgi:hypothetical protein
LRPWIELEFVPARAAATATEASVQFTLTNRNTGNAPARNVRVMAQMFNAGAERDGQIDAFFAKPVEPGSVRALQGIPAREQIEIGSAVAMAKELVREVAVEGRRLFVPVVAFNVLYEWGGGRSGQTCMSYVVGREAETPQEKMGAFRLDLGPRIYRSVGQRQTTLAKIV